MDRCLGQSRLDVVAPKVVRLRFLQDYPYRPMGSRQSLEADAPIIAASNINLQFLVRESMFREDLLNGLRIMILEIPALRERDGDVPMLVRPFSQKLTVQYRRDPKHVPAGVMTALCEYHFSGQTKRTGKFASPRVPVRQRPRLCSRSDGNAAESAPRRGFDAGGRRVSPELQCREGVRCRGVRADLRGPSSQGGARQYFGGGAKIRLGATGLRRARKQIRPCEGAEIRRRTRIHSGARLRFIGAKLTARLTADL